MSEGKVISTINGGLGNQMFQYAAGRALALRLGVPLELDISFYGAGRHRSFELGKFGIVAAMAAKRGLFAKLLGGKDALPEFDEAHFHFDPRFDDLHSPVKLEGYFQSPRYFAGYSENIRRELTPPNPVDRETLALGARMGGEGSISLHVRRGDYVSKPSAASVFSQCTLDYYRKALKQLPADLPVYVFTDDLVWAKSNLEFGRALIFAGDRPVVTGLGDLWLMTKASHHIIANSTFSWWGAWLKTAIGTTIAPTPWFKTDENSDVDLIPENWLKIELGGQANEHII